MAVSTVCCDHVAGGHLDWDQVGPWHGSEAGLCSVAGDLVLVSAPVPSYYMVWSLWLDVLFYKNVISLLFLLKNNELNTHLLTNMAHETFIMQYVVCFV